MSPIPSIHDLPATFVAAEANRFVVGQDSKGRWVALEIHGRGGGLFRDRQAAFHYASAETGRCPEAVVVSGGLIELRP
ncbi:hypothetical protein [Methylobacterium sp. J-076]|uniref:hypothetical protein n=1 Tax=Methylobacterium sp. J-076 TaxID=2836655 RepID=UPI001FBB91F1|nr:hypothetical protein [Methylobacterium sp. J-076]MCJ2015440.1 hypothetical protein [Methylobacterium sp. J-076]